MRLLPDKPSLDFLRKEAKDLLAVLRETSPRASLAEAQQALAAQYGMHDWSELKSEALRRAANAPVAPDGLADALATTFDLGTVIGSAAPVSFTPMGRCWSITTDRGRWLAVTVHAWITEAQAELGTRLRDAAVASGVTAPSPVRSPGGRLIETVQDQSWRVHEWIDVGPMPVTPTPTAVARRVGAIHGALHGLAIPSETPINRYVTARGSDADWARLLDRARTARAPWAEQLNEALPMLFDLRRIELDIGSDELILCNCNLIPEHVRMGHNNELVVTEWDFAGSLTPRLELGFALGQWMLRPLADRTTIQAFRDGYVEAAGGWPRLGLSSFAVAVTGWLNWLYNTICEAIDPRDSDHAVFAQRSTVDLLSRPMTRESLEQILAAVDDQ
jgi:hypothetical protein